MPTRRSLRLVARHAPYPDQTTGSTQSEDPTARPPRVRLATPLPQELPAPSPPTSSLVQPPTPLQPSIPTPATPMSGPPTAPTPVLPDLGSLKPARLTSSPTMPSPTHSSLILPLRFRGHGMFHQAQNFTISHSQFIDSSSVGTGIRELLKHSMPDAFYNSSARYPPPKCHLGTRNEYIDLVIKWARGESDRKEPILWMRGPFGIGKSAVAQSCAEALAPIDKLAATLFFSRSNADRDDPRRVFTSITYQIATKCPSFQEIIDKRMISDPALATTSPLTQFEDLLVQCLREVDATGSGLDGRVVIIDGLDECRGVAEQCEIIRIIAASAHNHTTPFRWFITSRPEDPIIRTMNSTAVSPVRSCIELPVSREIDHEILLFLTDEFKKIREDHDVPEPWPSEEALALLVGRGAGLWIYVATMVRFIKDENSYGPKDQLQIVLEFARDVSAKAGVDNPLAEMDFFYTLIMQRVPPKVRVTVRKILLMSSVYPFDADRIANILCLSEEQFRRACASIQSVMELRRSDFKSTVINFYHTSFLDFMKDSQRSKELCIRGDFLIGYRRELLGWLHEVFSRSADSSHIMFPSGTILPEGVSSLGHYYRVLLSFWQLCGIPEHPLDSQTAMSLAKLPFGKMLRFAGHHSRSAVNVYSVRANLPAEFHDKTIRRDKCPIPGCTSTKNVWILGHGENESVPVQSDYGFRLVNNQDQPDGKCMCQVE